MSADKERAINISVDEFKRPIGPMSRGREVSSIGLACKAWLTDGINYLLRRELETSDWVLFSKFLDSIEVEMAKMTILESLM